MIQSSAFLSHCITGAAQLHEARFLETSNTALRLRVVKSAQWAETLGMCSAVLTHIPPSWPHSLYVNFLSALVATKHKDVSITRGSKQQEDLKSKRTFDILSVTRQHSLYALLLTPFTNTL
ncbi:hypothetical protein F7725_027353 [Dissostichus mawsoni]|uniref:Uncharacterized protein n=1 Tax=Dissostichus mawsoni TaxID=36200 RepID=A0A7J5XCP1_DISMA|nr:hypothetical protein F7725_027353 [Dissostichus mawsoni]